MTGHRDLVAGRVADARRAVDEDRAEENHVTEERERLEHDRKREPARVGVRDARDAVADRVVGARHCGHHERDDHRGAGADQHAARHAQPPSRAGQLDRCY